MKVYNKFNTKKNIRQDNKTVCNNRFIRNEDYKTEIEVNLTKISVWGRSFVYKVFIVPITKDRAAGLILADQAYGNTNYHYIEKINK